jgi:4-aminobutyrate aminotransferase-like enzyme/Ser/Thr protein kinase RdoA (MazF antagonist)
MDDVLLHAPALSSADAVSCALTLFGVVGDVSALPSERDQNFLLETAAGDRFVLKIANSADGRALLEAQNAALLHVARRSTLCPRVIASIDGATIAEMGAPGGARHFVRLFSWLPGEPLAVVPQPPALLEDLGRKVAELDAALEGFDHPAIHREFYWDLARGIPLVRELAPLVTDDRMRALVTGLIDRIASHDAPRFARLRRAAVHNDPNDYNVLVSLPPEGGSHEIAKEGLVSLTPEGGSHEIAKEGLVSLTPGGEGGETGTAHVASAFRRKIIGILDFGDIVHSYGIADLAIAIAYAVLGKPDPLAAAVSVVRGYQDVRPLEDDEVASLLGLVLLRLCTSVCVAARQQRQRPGDDYLSVSQGPIAATLPALAAIDPGAAAAAFRHARGKTPEETLAARRRVIGSNLSVAYRHPVKIVRGWMQYLYDHAGRRYLDGYNNVPHVGHSHPRVVQAVTEQMLLLNTNTRYLHDRLAMFADRLIATLPDPLRVCYFVNSGSEANELALRLARAHTRRRDVIVLDGAYHGNTTTLIDISPYKFNGRGGEGAPPWVHVLPLPDTYRGKFKADDPRAGEKYAEFARYVRNPGAFIAESAPSVGGQIILPERYLASVYAIVRGAGGVCIADEVQTAYGRMGTHFYAFEAQRVVPDIVVLGKPIGNGYPLGAVVTTAEIAASFDNGMEFFSTFGGSTVSCAAGLAVLDVVQEEGLQAHAREVGDALLGRLRGLGDRHSLVGDVRGSGLFLGVELVRSRDSLEPAASEAAEVVELLRERGILIGTDGPYANVLKIRPPMPFTDDDGDLLARTLDDVLGVVNRT